MGKVDATEMRRLKIESLDIDTRFGSVDIKERVTRGGLPLYTLRYVLIFYLRLSCLT